MEEEIADLDRIPAACPHCGECCHHKVPEKDQKIVVTELAEELELEAEKGISLVEFLLLLCKNFGIEPENTKKILGIESDINVESTPLLIKAKVINESSRLTPPYLPPDRQWRSLNECKHRVFAFGS